MKSNSIEVVLTPREHQEYIKFHKFGPPGTTGAAQELLEPTAKHGIVCAEGRKGSVDGIGDLEKDSGLMERGRMGAM